MSVTIGVWVFPTLWTIFCFVMIFRPYRKSGDYDFGEIFRLFWLVPLLVCWVIYLAVT